MKNIFLDFIILPLKMVGFVKHVLFPLGKRTKNLPIIEVRRSSTNQWLIEPFTLNQKLIFKLLTGVIFNKRIIKVLHVFCFCFCFFVFF